MAEIARLVEVDLREVWPYEARDFTPWLASNLDLLGEALGIDIEPLGETEVAVGPFSLDINARDANENRTIIIENQLEKTDHDHLGKVLTYAAGFNADVMVWIVKEFQDEHRQALDWLNQRTSEETELYGVVVRAVRIGVSPPAPVFDVVARPNIFRKSRNGRRDDRQPLNLNEQAYLAFWPKVIDKLIERRFVSRKRTTQNQSLVFWSQKITGGNGVALAADFTQQSARALIHIDPFADREQNHELFDELEQMKEDLEKQYGQSLQKWWKSPQKVCRIGVERPGTRITDDESSLEATAQWMVDSLIALSDKVVPHVQEAIARQEQPNETEEA